LKDPSENGKQETKEDLDPSQDKNQLYKSVIFSLVFGSKKGVILALEDISFLKSLQVL
jgi:hypothetical protein